MALLTTFLSDAQSSVGARLFGARNTKSGTIESAVAILRHGAIAFYWIAGGSAGPGMTVILAQLLEQLKEEGVEVFDFVGANTVTHTDVLIGTSAHLCVNRSNQLCNRTGAGIAIVLNFH